MQYSIPCVSEDLKSLQAFHQTQLKGYSESCGMKAGEKCDYAHTHTNACTHMHAQRPEAEQPPAVLQQEVYCRQHSCNNKAGSVLEGDVLHDSGV